jgi:predicted PurR-regulated permease PerM
MNIDKRPPDHALDHRDSQPASSARIFEMAIRLSVLGLLIYLCFTLISPFLTIAIWSAVIAVALYPLYCRIVEFLNGRRKIAAVLLTIVTFLVVLGPATWLALGLLDGAKTLYARVEATEASLPRPSEAVKEWPVIGEQIYQAWNLAADNLRSTLEFIAPQLKQVASGLMHVVASAGIAALTFFAAIAVAGFLYAPAPAIGATMKSIARKLDTERGEEFIHLSAESIRAVSRGVVGISAVQAFFAGIGLIVAGIPGATLIMSAVLILGIIQVGPSVILVPLVVWSWWQMDTMHALLFTAYMVPVSLMDNVLRPLVMGRGLRTPTLIVLIGVIGGTIAYGITGLFLGPIILAVIWELLKAWTRDTAGLKADELSASRDGSA